MKYKTIAVDGLKKPVRLMKKSDSMLMRFWGAILGPFTPAFMARFWTTVAIPFRPTTVYTPTKYDADPDWGSGVWIKRHADTWAHETGGDGDLEGHARQAEKWTAVGLAFLYSGPTPWLLALACLFLPAPLALDASWWFPGSILIAAGGCLPLSVGFAWGRWRVERQPYLIGIRRGRSIDNVVETLWKNYVFTWPRSWMKAWFEKHK